MRNSLSLADGWQLWDSKLECNAEISHIDYDGDCDSGRMLINQVVITSVLPHSEMVISTM